MEEMRSNEELDRMESKERAISCSGKSVRFSWLILTE